MKNIAFILNSIRFGGAERQTIDLINGLASYGHNISLIVLNESGDSEYLKSTINTNIDIYDCNIKKYYDKNKLKEIQNYIKNRNIDICFSVGFYSTMYCSMLNNLSYLKKVCIIHTTQLPNLKEQFKMTYYKKMINSMNYRIFVSRNQMMYLEKKYKISTKNSYVIHNGIDVNKFNINKLKKYNIEQILNQYRLNKDKINFCYSAMLRKEKNHLFLVEAVRRLVSNGYKNIQFILAGDGSEFNNIQDKIKEYNLEEFIYLIGKQKEIEKIYSICDYGVIVSNSVETFSLAALEQLASGIPMIMSDIGGANEMIINGYNGYLFKQDNIDELVNILIKCINEYENIENIKNNSINIVNSIYRKEDMINKYIKFIDKI